MRRNAALTRRPLPRTVLSTAAFAAALSLSACAIPGLPGATGAPEPRQQVAAVRVSSSETTPSPTPSPSLTPKPSSSSSPTATPSPDTEPSPEPATAPPPSPSPPAAPLWEAVAGDLSSGSKTHRLGTAAHTLVIDYWTTEDVAEWTPDSTPIINLNARIDGAATGEAIRVTRFNARVDALGLVLAEDQGSFAIEPPFAYSSALAVPGNPQGASTKILVTIDLLTETAPGSGVFTRQTVMDALTIGYPKPGTVALAAAEKAARR